MNITLPPAETTTISSFLTNFTVSSVIAGDYAKILYENFVDYLRSALDHLVILLLIYTFGCLVSYWFICYSRRWWRRFRGPFRATELPDVKRTLIVTAHPDDESMFFAPTILGLKEQDPTCRIFVLCLSNGNFDKKGRERRRELWNACEVLSIDQSDVTLLNSTHLQDDPNTEWKVEIIAQIVLKHIEALDIQLVITFDKDGISHHPNHCAIFYAVASLCFSSMLPKECKVLTLESVNVLRKYISLFDLPISLLMSTNWSILSWANRRHAQRAMYEHKSQLLWFRRLYIIFSRYMIINSLREIDFEFDFEFDVVENS